MVSEMTSDLQWKHVFYCKLYVLFGLFFEPAQIFNNTTTAFRFSGCAYVATMQIQPMVHIYLVLFRHYLFELSFHRDHIFTHGKLSAIGHAKYMRINGDCWPVER
ncbi:hypothetical protein N478_24485 [Pseudoalteromonas luteoviolacea S4060-1]|uniref:Uncharacterized protein n=1 Tax=Pseudoalteromonas luteoviolacea S4060-1 TaxID=1365257 RepID=A0A167KR31_9GAMM|nr:hypothetical protein N478_24485 [Pseudoalteromonas luteoviolacea S4060-1]